MPTQFTVTVSDADLAILKHDLIDPEQWLRQAVTGKISACAKRLVAEARQVLEADPAVESMPAKPVALVAAYIARPGYKNRKAKEDEKKAREQTPPVKAGKP